jgi:ankyrin repeat protein
MYSKKVACDVNEEYIQAGKISFGELEELIGTGNFSKLATIVKARNKQVHDDKQTEILRSLIIAVLNYRQNTGKNTISATHFRAIVRSLCLGADMNKFFSVGGSDQITLLQLCTLFLNVDLLRLLLSAGAEVNAIGKNGWSSLHQAVYYGNNAVIYVLIEFGAVLNTQDLTEYGNTPLIEALLGENYNIANYLLSKEALASLPNRMGMLPLHYAALNDAEDRVTLSLLNAYKAGIERHGAACGNTPLHFASSVRMAKLLYNACPNVLNAINANKETALHCNLRKGNVKVASYLLSRGGIDVNAENYKKQTPLHYAVLNNANITMVMKLLKNGAQVNRIDEHNKSALDYALDMPYENRAVRQALIGAGSSIERVPHNIRRQNLGFLRSSTIMDREVRLHQSVKDYILLMAVERKSTLSINDILDAGANPDGAKNANGLTVAKLASEEVEKWVARHRCMGGSCVVM